MLSTVAVQLRVPPPLLDIAMVWLAGLAPTVVLKVRRVGIRPIVGGTERVVADTIPDCADSLPAASYAETV